jgi:hypothetical protein
MHLSFVASRIVTTDESRLDCTVAAIQGGPNWNELMTRGGRIGQ